MAGGHTVRGKACYNFGADIAKRKAPHKGRRFARMFSCTCCGCIHSRMAAGREGNPGCKVPCTYGNKLGDVHTFWNMGGDGAPGCSRGKYQYRCGRISAVSHTGSYS